jgi:gliding motility-associated protein GldM
MMSTMNPAPATKFKLLFIAPITGLLLLGIGCVNGQTVSDHSKVVIAVETVKMNVLYIGIENPVNISVSGYTPDQVEVKTDNGKIEGSNGKYIVKPKTPGKAVITVTAKGEVVQERAFRVKFMPEPVVALNPPPGSSLLIKGGEITKETLLKAGGIIATVENAEFDLPIKVASFALSTITAGNNQTSEAMSENGKFTSAQENIIKGLSKGQRIIIDDIAASGPDGKTRKMPVSMVFTIKE